MCCRAWCPIRDGMCTGLWLNLVCGWRGVVSRGLKIFNVVIQGKIQWAMAGRNQGKLETVRSKLVAIDKMCKVCCQCAAMLCGCNVL